MEGGMQEVEVALECFLTVEGKFKEAMTRENIVQALQEVSRAPAQPASPSTSKSGVDDGNAPPAKRACVELFSVAGCGALSVLLDNLRQRHGFLLTYHFGNDCVKHFLMSLISLSMHGI